VEQVVLCPVQITQEIWANPNLYYASLNFCQLQVPPDNSVSSGREFWHRSQPLKVGLPFMDHHLTVMLCWRACCVALRRDQLAPKTKHKGLAQIKVLLQHLTTVWQQVMNSWFQSAPFNLVLYR